jgi:hypothetical protein
VLIAPRVSFERWDFIESMIRWECREASIVELRGACSVACFVGLSFIEREVCLTRSNLSRDAAWNRWSGSEEFY